MKVRILLHKPKKWDWLGQGIRFWTWLVSAKNRTVGPYDHAEVWMADEQGLFSIVYDELLNWPVCTVFQGTCWTSTMRGKDNGTVKRPASEVVHNPDRWDVCEMFLEKEQLANMMSYMEAEVKANKGYSKWDILKFISPLHFEDSKRNICSEFVNNAIHATCPAGWKRGVISPRRLAYKLVQAGHEIKSLSEF